eukprot:5555180-Heterocapsa_arctica.AAC.1
MGTMIRLIGKGIIIVVQTAAVWPKNVRRYSENSNKMESAPWRHGSESKEQGDYPPDNQETPPWEIRPQL